MLGTKYLTKFSLVFLAVSLIACLVSISRMLFAWYTSKDLDTTSDAFYSSKEGYEEHFITYSSLYGENIVSYDSAEAVDNFDFIPGDVVYFSFIFDLKTEEIEKGDEYTITLTIEVDNEDFLANTVIEENECRLALVYKEDDVYTFIEEIAITNTECESLASCSFNIAIPSYNDYGTYYYTDSSSVNHVRLMAFVPIWYKDTGLNQNEEMASTLEITKTLITN